MEQTYWDAIVIGGGAAGLSAAQALGRSLRRTLVIDGGTPRNRFAEHMHNVLGLDGTPPLELLARGREEAERYGVEFLEGSVRAVRDRGAGPAQHGGTGAGGIGAHGTHTTGSDIDPAAPGATVELELADGRSLTTRALVVATGVNDVLPPIPGLAERWGRSVLHCPYCHGWEVRGKRIGIVTTSPMSLHQAKLLRQWSDEVTVFTAGLRGPEGTSTLDGTSERGLLARGVRLVPDTVAEIIGDGAEVTAVRTVDGRHHPIDAVFTGGAMVPQDGFLDGLGLDRSDTPAGSFLVVDQMGRTSHARIWAAGNVVNPGASIPLVMGAGNFAGAAVNFALVEEDLAAAASAHAHHVDEDDEPSVFWERRYADADRVWSGRVNTALAEVAEAWTPGRSLDLGSGEGGDVLWLSEQGWEASGIELSETAVSRARETASARGADASFTVADLGEWAASAVDSERDLYDLVTASFLQSPVELPRERILRAARERVAPGGRIVVVSHAAPPSWASGHCGPFPTPEDELAALALDPDRWVIDVAEVRVREAWAPDGSPATLEDTVVVARRVA